MTTLTTPRLLLRTLEPGDLSPAMEFLCSDHTMRHLGGVQTPPDAWRTFASWLGMHSLTDGAMFAVVERASGAWLGRIGPWTPHSWPVREVGWGLLQRAEGQGFAFEAAIASIDYAFDALDWDRVDHLIDDANAPSQRLAEKLGSQPGELTELPGRLAGHPVRAWGQTREQWRAQRENFDFMVPREGGL